jgi:hypothetical protein
MEAVIWKIHNLSVVKKFFPTARVLKDYESIPRREHLFRRHNDGISLTTAVLGRNSFRRSAAISALMCLKTEKPMKLRMVFWSVMDTHLP